MYNRGKASLKSITLPSNLMAIGNNAFLNCGRLTNIIIPPSVYSIGDDAFASCISLPDIFISSNISFIGITAFHIIPNDINVDSDNKNFSSVDGVLFNKAQTKLLKCPTSKTGSYIIPSTVTTICNAAFGGCTGLTDITIPSSVTTIEKSCFSSCKGITSIDLSSSVISLGRYAFVQCENLETITIPASVTTMEYGALSDCKKLKSIYSLKETPPVLEPATKVFSGVDFKKCILYVPFGSKTLYASATLWKDFENIVELASPAPVANAGIDLTVDEGEIVTLDGSESYDPNNDSISYSWIAPYGITLDSATSAKPIFTAPKVSSDTVFVFSLVVNDGTVDSPADEVMITVKNINKTPVADAGVDLTVEEGEIVKLNGSASNDRDNDSLSYSWIAPYGISLDSATSVRPIFTAPEVSSDTVFVFSLTVNDRTIDSPADEVMITVKNVNKAPVANAGFDQTVMEGGTVVLDGSASFDPDGTAISYLWSAPAGVTLNKSDLANPTFVVPDVSELTRFSFLLTVSDDQYTSQPDTVVITVEKKTGIDDDELISPKQVQVYPNPTTGLLTISMEDYLGQSPLVEVFNSMGQLVLKTESKVDSRNIEMDMSVFSQGIYTLRISVGKKQYQQKIVKK